MEAEKNTLQQQVMDRAMKDEAFRQMLLSNPKGTLERELGLALPAGVTIQVHENTPTVLHLVLPIQEQTGVPQDLSDAELEQVIGGQGSQDSDQTQTAFGDTDHGVVAPQLK